LPTVIFSKNVKDYPAFVDIWGDVGTFEEDGSYVFRNNKNIPLAVYLDLETEELRQGQ